MKIEKIKKITLETPIKVYDLSVKKYENFCVGKHKICIHNCEYLHGEDNLSNVIVNMARRYEGSNNLPIMKDQGSFGNRFINEASADRYISTSAEDYLELLFPKDDLGTLESQEFEGSQIEPRYFTPVIPMLLVNGAPSSISTGFFQNVLPRPYKKIIKMVENYIETGKVKVPAPGWEGFKGSVKQDSENKRKWIVYGKFNRVNSTSLEITEIPVGIELQKYISILDLLVENKVISSYEDKSEDNKFHFRVRVSRKFSEMSDYEIMDALKLVDYGKRFVENYTCMGSDNRIDVCDSPEDVFRKYIKVREMHYGRRKQSLIDQTNEKIELLKSKIKFIQEVIDGNIIIYKNSKQQIVEQIDKFEDIHTVDGNYDYLLRMPLYSLTTERIVNLDEELTTTIGTLMAYENTELVEFWKQDISKLKEYVSKSIK